MRVLTVRQPWAWAIIHAGKGVENRARNIVGSYRGPVAIHAASRRTADWATVASSIERITGEAIPPFDGHDSDVLGAVIGVVDLTDVHHASACPGGIEDGEWMRPFCSPWAMDGHWHLVLTNPRPLAQPIPAKGRLGLWRPDDQLHAAIEAQLDSSRRGDA